MTTHTLDGPDLEALLARVPVELGPDATIIAANKLRTGGIGGFFARERFEVTVEVPDSPASVPAPSLAGDGGPRLSTSEIGFSGVLDRMVRDAGGADSAPRPVGPSAGRLHAAPLAAAAPPADLAPADLAPADEPFVPLEPTRLATPTPTPTSEPVPEPRQAPSVLGTGSGLAVPTGTVAGTAGGVVPGAAGSLAGPAGGLVTETHGSVAGPSGVLVTGAAGSLAGPSGGPVAQAHGPTGPGGIEPVAAGAQMASTRPVPAGPLLDQQALARVGLPLNVAAHLPGGGGSDPTVALYQLMDRLALPEALPTMAGSVIAVVGDRREAMAVLERFAAQLGTDSDDILVAASRRTAGVAEEQRLATPEQACERRRSWRRRRRPTLVAVDAGVCRNGRPWATELLDALEPTMVWGVVEANRKAEDIRDWADRLGGLDALAVTGLKETVSPAAVLGAGIPVGLLDDDEATAARWTAILAERLELAA